MVFWDGDGGPKAFRSAAPHTPIVACWADGDRDGPLCIGDLPVFEDPEFASHVRTQANLNFDMDDIIVDGQFTLKRLLPPDETAKQTHEARRCHYSFNTRYSVRPDAGGVWWPIWLVGRTKTGWWAIRWYQALDGTWFVTFWWYADVHVHLLDTYGEPAL